MAHQPLRQWPTPTRPQQYPEPVPPHPTLPDAPRWAALLTGWRRNPTAPTLQGRLTSTLQTLISTGQLSPGERLPAERPLAALLGLSRNTVAQALDDLAASGWVTRRVGSGTHVSGSAPRTAPLLTLRTPVSPPPPPPPPPPHAREFDGVFRHGVSPCSVSAGTSRTRSWRVSAPAPAASLC
ncbi:GntR family transcriptional regulator [Deinococcus sp. A31D244]|uniref:GntR family transcriptional regulator n=1 Tax=Deinococcus sp. A31D244 TaxID=3397675 RepID=UPI0039E08EF9